MAPQQGGDGGPAERAQGSAPIGRVTVGGAGTSVLLVDGEAGSRSRIRAQMQDQRIDVTVAATLAEARAALARCSFDVVIVESMLPDGTALDVIDRLRAAGSTSHVIVLGRSTGEGDPVRAFDRGADDFVVKPFYQGELTARVLAVGRRRSTDADMTLQIGRLDIDLQSRAVSAGGETVELTTKEFDLLAYMAMRPGQVFDREQLLNAVWRSASEWQQAATVTEHVRRLRKKLDVDPAHPTLLTTVRGVGYRLDLPTTDSEVTTAVGHATAELHRLVVGVGVLDDLSDSIIITDLDLHIRGWNGAAERLYGWSADEVRGRHVHDFLHWVDDSDQIPEIREHLEHTGRWHGEGTQLARDGSPMEILSTTTVIRSEAGDPLGIVWVNRTVSDACRCGPIERDTTLATRLRQGLASDEFQVHYQPVVDLADNRLISLEALVRWEHPERGTLLPEEFLDTAETSGLIVELGERVLDKACRQAADWRRSGADIHLSVNVSTRQLADPGMVERFTSIIRHSGFDPAYLWLEVTETALVEEMEQARDALRRLVDLGVGVSIDDFGTGWASLSYLQRFPVHALKIDRSFVARVGQTANDTAIVRSIVSLGAELELFVVAEGVETKAQHDELKKLGCSIGQGYLFGRPVAGSDVPIERADRITGAAPEPSDVHAPAATEAAPHGPAADTWPGVCAYPTDESPAVVWLQDTLVAAGRI